jgi:hypothetical protein
VIAASLAFDDLAWTRLAGLSGSATALAVPAPDRRCSPTGPRPSIVLSSNSGAPVDQAWGLHAVGYWTGYLVIERG